MHIYFVRHGLTASNKQRRLMGSRIDESLAPEGLEQARELACGLVRDFEVLYSSPLLRAVETATIVGKELQLAVHIRSQLTERDSGILSGKTWDEVASYTDGKLTYEKLKSHKELDYTPYGGESVMQVRERLAQFFEEVRRDHLDKKILVVTHGGIIRVMYKHFSSVAEPEDLHNASVHQFTI